MSVIMAALYGLRDGEGRLTAWWCV
jgi:hypothetical protein